MRIPTLVALLSLAPVVEADVLAFVGAPRYVELSEKSCMDYLDQSSNSKDEISICMDRAFLMKYSVQSPVIGTQNHQIVEFVGFYHYWGIPEYTTFEPAFVVLGKEKDNYLLRYIERAESRDGEWWVCEEWSDDDSECLSESTVQEMAKRIAEQI